MVKIFTKCQNGVNVEKQIHLWHFKWWFQCKTQEQDRNSFDFILQGINTYAAMDETLFYLVSQFINESLF